ncbi:MAG: hypothetical protein LPK45_11195 [Bacteroidota bacterium]|nr:hypothetical protein [Bacteroidota bacterium]MDX5431670.1 hypothetical protein [Bacteroidota bacterium]MDX5470386.1 hypothetical protein [Bacteroidota bacterium]
MRNFQAFILISFLALILFENAGCRKESFETDPGSKLEFSEDTVVFDTVFTKLGGGPNPRSVNRRFTVINPHNRSIKTNIHLGRGAASPFRINVDGIPLNEIKGFEIRPKDSSYVFVEVTIDPNNQNNPLIEWDSVVFVTNGNTQDVKLAAWGQDAHYFSDEVLSGNLVWADKEKPYVIFNSVLVEEGSSLTIEEGVKVYSSVGSYLYVAGTLIVNGSKEFPVVMQGARLEQDYRNTPSQWVGIRFLTTSRDNVIRFAEIKNGIIGIQVDSLQNGGGYKLRISNTRILNMAAGGLIGYTAWIDAQNVLSANCGQYTFLGELGGNYRLRHCTFANYNTTFLRSKPAFGLSNADYNDGQNPAVANDLNFLIQNSIVYGSLKEELAFFSKGQGSFSGNISNTALKTEFKDFNTNGNQINIDPKFVNFRELNFELDTLSPAMNVGATPLNPPILDDLKGELRDAQPDLGAFERKE